ncbi:adenosine deaminase [Clostridium tyrobutyricum]|uniref:adenosine deaminase n=1 Tax=Clostridium tyrobutyricum TaxID=1519 RepID=UPI0030CDFAF4
MNLNKLLETIPKTDLHCHLDGSIRPQTMIDISRKDNISLPSYSISELEKYVKVSGKCDSLKDYLNKFDIPIKIMQSYDNIYRITSELLEDAARQNICYMEIRFAPFNHLQKGLSLKDVINASIDAIKDGRKKYGIASNLILCAMRHESPEMSKDLVNTVKDFIGLGVSAIDLAGNEADFPPEIHREAFDMAKYYGLHRTVHAGETGNPANIIKSIELLNAERIGHGVFAFKDSHVVEYLKRNNIPLEVCITSNVNTSAVNSYKEHPVKSYMDNGIIITVNTDNTTVSNTSIVDEFKYLVKYQNFTLNDIKKVIKNSIDYSFADKKDKDSLNFKFLSFVNDMHI